MTGVQIRTPSSVSSRSLIFAPKLHLAVLRVRGQRLWIDTPWLSQGPVR